MGDQPAPAEDELDPNDPYRYGKPDHPIAPEYAPPAPPPSGSLPPPPGAHPPPPPGAYPPPPPGAYPPPPPGAYPPPPPNYWQYPPPPPPSTLPRTSGKGTAAYWLGVAALFFSFLAYVDVVFVLLAVIFGLQSLNDPDDKAQHRRARLGLILAGLGTVAAVSFAVEWNNLAARCGGWSHFNEPGFAKCIQKGGD